MLTMIPKDSRRTPFVIAMVLFVAYLSGCKGADGPTGPPGPKLTGRLIGFISLVDVDGVTQADLSGVTVSITGTSISATSDASGKFILDGVETGTYEIVYSKTGYGTYKKQGFSFASGGTSSISLVKLGQIPNYTVTSITGTTSAAVSITVTGTVNSVPSGKTQYYVIYVGKTNDVTGTDPQKYLAYKYVAVSGGGTSFSVSWTVSELRALGVISTSTPTLSFIAYATNGYSYAYYHLETNRNVEPTLSATPSNVFSGNTP